MNTLSHSRGCATALFLLAGLLAGGAAQARTDVGISIGLPLPGVVVSPGYPAEPAYVVPPPVYGPPPVYYAPAPVYRPPVYAPPVQYVPAPGFAPYYAEPRPRYYPQPRWDRDHDGIPDRHDRYDNRRDGYYRR